MKDLKKVCADIGKSKDVQSVVLLVLNNKTHQVEVATHTKENPEVLEDIGQRIKGLFGGHLDTQTEYEDPQAIEARKKQEEIVRNHKQKLAEANKRNSITNRKPRGKNK